MTTRAVLTDANAPGHLIKGEIQRTMNDYVGVVRNDEGLGTAVATFDGLIRNELPVMAPAGDGRIANYDWIEALEVEAMVSLARLIASAARLRTESRGAHYREDFPDPDDTSWLRNIRVRKQGDETAFDIVPVPADMAAVA